MYVIKTLNLASYLIDKGYKIRKIDTNRDNPNFKVFLFDDTKQIRKEVEKYKKECRNNNNKD